MSSLLPWTSQRHLRVWHPVTTDSEPHDEATSAAEVHKKLEDYCSVCIVRIVVVGVPWLRPIRQHERQGGSRSSSRNYCRIGFGAYTGTQLALLRKEGWLKLLVRLMVCRTKEDQRYIKNEFMRGGETRFLEKCTRRKRRNKYVSVFIL